MEEYYLALDVGGSNIRVGLGDTEGFIDGKRREVETSSYWSGNGLRELVEDSLEEFDVSMSSLDGIGIGVPGLVDTDGKEMIYSHSLDELSLGNLEELDVNLQLENDANTAVVGEKFYGEGRGVDNMATVIIGSGVGGGIYYGGSLLGSEKGGRSPEPAGIVVEEDMMWDRAVGGERMPGYIENLLESDERETELPDNLDAEEIFRLSENNEVIREYVEKIAELNERGISTLINTYAPELITFSGSVAVENPEFMKKSFEKVEEQAINPLPTMKVSELGNELGLYGALALAQRKHLEE